MSAFIAPDNFSGMKAVIGILVRRLGGSVTLTQADFDDIAGFMIGDNCAPDSLHIEIIRPDDPRLDNPKEKQ